RPQQLYTAQNCQFPCLLCYCGLEQAGFVRFLWPKRTSLLQSFQLPLRHRHRVRRKARVALSILHKNLTVISNSPPRSSEPKPAIEVLAGSERFVEAYRPQGLGTGGDGHKNIAFA